MKNGGVENQRLARTHWNPNFKFREAEVMNYFIIKLQFWRVLRSKKDHTSKVEIKIGVGWGLVIGPHYLSLTPPITQPQQMHKDTIGVIPLYTQIRLLRKG